MRFTLQALLLLVTLVATILGAIRLFWVSSQSNWILFFAAYLVLACLVTVHALNRKSRCRFAFVGASIFSVAYLVFPLRGGFGVALAIDAESFVNKTLIGDAGILITFLASQLTSLVLIETNP
jgi:hypothetical protein